MRVRKVAAAIGGVIVAAVVAVLVGVAFASHWSNVDKGVLIGALAALGLFLLLWGAGGQTFYGRRRQVIREYAALLRLDPHPEKSALLKKLTSETFLWLNRSRRPERATRFRAASRVPGTDDDQARAQVAALRKMRWLRRDPRAAD